MVMLENVMQYFGEKHFIMFNQITMFTIEVLKRRIQYIPEIYLLEKFISAFKVKSLSEFNIHKRSKP